MMQKRKHIAKIGLNDAELAQVDQLVREGGFKTRAALFRSAVFDAHGSDATLADEVGKLGLAVNGLSGRVPTASQDRLIKAVWQLVEAMVEQREPR